MDAGDDIAVIAGDSTGDEAPGPIGRPRRPAVNTLLVLCGVAALSVLAVAVIFNIAIGAHDPPAVPPESLMPELPEGYVLLAEETVQEENPFDPAREHSSRTWFLYNPDVGDVTREVLADYLAPVCDEVGRVLGDTGRVFRDLRCEGWVAGPHALGYVLSAHGEVYDGTNPVIDLVDGVAPPSPGEAVIVVGLRTSFVEPAP